MEFICQSCKKKYPVESLAYKCFCGGLFDYSGEDPNEAVSKLITLGEVITPLIKYKDSFYLKLDYYMPTGSFKDRGARTMISVLKEKGIEEVVEDSSGNAGAAISAYAAGAMIKCKIYFPESLIS